MHLGDVIVMIVVFYLSLHSVFLEHPILPAMDI